MTHIFTKQETGLCQALKQCLLEILKQYPQGISEYQLMVILQNPPYAIFAKNAMSETLALFQSHFLLFHCLYQLRVTGLTAQQYDVCISAVSIKLLPYVAATAGLVTPDKLQHYYLDWQNFSTTTEQDVESLLSQFWRRMAGTDLCSEPDDLSRNKIAEAYKIFDLPFNSDFKLVKASYLRLQHRHHPDKGGDKKRSQQLAAQFNLLKDYLHQHEC